MPHEEQREKNIRLVTEVALDCFLANGIEKTKVADIALRSGLTERSVFRYFETKADLVLAASLLYWKRILERIDRMSHTVADGGTTGLQDAENVLVCYSQLYRLDPNGMRFTLDAELTLHAAGRLHEIKNQPPEPFETSGGPMAKAIRKGLADGSISPAETHVKGVFLSVKGPELLNKYVGESERLIRLIFQRARERAATEAEREIARRLGCLLLRERTGETFTGVVSGVTEFGFFVEFDEMPVEGMVRLTTFRDDWFEYDPDRQELIGVGTGRRFRLGQAVTVRLTDVHIGRLEVNLELEGTTDTAKRSSSRRSAGGREAPGRSSGRKRNGFVPRHKRR